MRIFIRSNIHILHT